MNPRSRFRILLIWVTAGAAGIVVPGAAADDGDDARRKARRSPIVEAYERTRDSLVNLSATERVVVERWGVSLFGDVFRVPTEHAEHSVGSGFVIHEDGYIVTNAHVVSSGAELRATFADGSEYDAWIVARDTVRDLAVIKIDPPRPLKPIPLGRSDDLMIGEQTIAIGNPVGLQNTVTTGVISALHRELPVGGNVIYRDVIQTDASINPGNSGGPLLNVLGELIGINTAIHVQAQNIGFAIPVDQLHDILPDMLNTETLSKVELGMRVSGRDPGRVIQVTEGSPADAAGVELGDTVLSVDGRKISRGIDFYVEMLRRTDGDKVRMNLLRDGKPTGVTVNLRAVPKPDGVRLGRQLLGIEIANASDQAARKLGWGSKRGVIVISVEPRGPADRADIRPGDLLVSMGRYWLHDLDQVGTLLSSVGRNESIDVGIRRKSRGRIYGGEVRLHVR